MTIMSIKRDGPVSFKGVASVDLTAGNKIIATAFFITEIQGNYNAILGIKLCSFYFASIPNSVGW
jgi:hypothetical protein